MCDMNHKCNLTIELVQDEDNAEQGLESPVSDIEMLLTEDIDQPTFCPGTRGHDINPGPLNQRTEVCQSDRSPKKNGYEKVPAKDPNHNNELQSGESQPRQSCKKRRFCFFFAAVVLFLVILVVVVLVVRLKSHQVESSQPSVQALARDAQIYADEGKWIPGLCWKEDASCKEPYCYYANMDIAVLESLHQIPTNKDCSLNKNGCKLIKCNGNVECLECDQIKDEVEKKTYNCDDTLECCHALPLMKECLNSTGNGTKHIVSLFCSDEDSPEMPKVLCSPGWFGDSCDQPRSRNITCKCYKSGSNSFCVNYTNCSEMTFVSSSSSLCRKNNLTHCLDESIVCKSQSVGGDQCLCDIKDKDLNCCKTDIEEMNGSELGDKDLCWTTDAPCMKGYCNKTNRAFPVPALERVHKIDQSHPSCNGQNDEFKQALEDCNDNRIVNNYDVAEKLLNKSCDTTIKCCHVKYYGQIYFNISGNGNHQIASLICEHFDNETPPIFQCQQGWGGKRCNETNQTKIDCKCFQSYSLCENTTDCSEMMYLDERKSLCSKHNLTHCEFESHICRTKIQGKECLCNVDTHLAEAVKQEVTNSDLPTLTILLFDNFNVANLINGDAILDMKGQPNLINGAAILGRFTGIFTRNSLAFVICFVLVHLHQST